MLKILRLNREKIKYLIISSFIIIAILLVVVAFKNEKKILGKKNLPISTADLSIVKDFFLKKIDSPFYNLEYETT